MVFFIFSHAIHRRFAFFGKREDCCRFFFFFSVFFRIHSHLSSSCLVALFRASTCCFVFIWFVDSDKQQHTHFVSHIKDGNSKPIRWKRELQDANGRTAFAAESESVLDVAFSTHTSIKHTHFIKHSFYRLRFLHGSNAIIVHRCRCHCRCSWYTHCVYAFFVCALLAQRLFS